MNYTFHPHAEKELQEVDSFYDDISEELGKRFRKEIASTISRILRYPRGWQPVSKIHRRCILNDFPYGIVYRFKPHEIRVIAVMHLHRKQDYWAYCI